MKTQHNIILQLLRVALSGKIEKLPDGVKWQNVKEEAIRQGVLGLCLDGVELLPQEMRPPMPVLMQMIGQVLSMEGEYERHRGVISDLAALCRRNGIRVMLLKGFGLSLYWPQPKHRPVGDLDVYFFGNWERADKLFSNQFGVRVDEGHEHHTRFVYKGVMVENHYDFINVKAHKDAPMIEAKLKELSAFDTNIVKGIEDVSAPSPDFNAIFLIRHLGQHFAGERVTLRQVLDWGLFLQKDGACVHWNEILPFLDDIGIRKFFNQVNSICVDYLGIVLPVEIAPAERDEDLEQRILMDILEPEFSEEKPKALIPVLAFKFRRWWHNRWKHKLVYNESLLPMFFTLLWSKVRRIGTITD